MDQRDSRDFAARASLASHSLAPLSGSDAVRKTAFLCIMCKYIPVTLPAPPARQTPQACTLYGTVAQCRLLLDGREGVENAADLLSYGERQRARPGMAARIGGVRAPGHGKGSDAGAMALAGGHASVPPAGERSVGDPGPSCLRSGPRACCFASTGNISWRCMGSSRKHGPRRKRTWPRRASTRRSWNDEQGAHGIQSR